MHPEDRTQILLEDIRAQFDVLAEHIDGVEQRLTKRIENLEVQMAEIIPLVRKHDRDIKAIRKQLPN